MTASVTEDAGQIRMVRMRHLQSSTGMLEMASCSTQAVLTPEGCLMALKMPLPYFLAWDRCIQIPNETHMSERKQGRSGGEVARILNLAPNCVR